jgi:hypothetical protein
MVPCNRSSDTVLVPMKDTTIHLHFPLLQSKVLVTMTGIDIVTAASMSIVGRKSSTSMEVGRVSTTARHKRKTAL